MEISSEKNKNNTPRSRELFPRWSTKKMDRDRFLAALHEGFWMLYGMETMNLNELISRIEKIIKDACNMAMPRVTNHPAKNSVYWWREEIAIGRDRCRMARRRYTRARARKSCTV
ncbi:hypothetical protein P5V15_002862 [Pogonomyrmex californicus]